MKNLHLPKLPNPKYCTTSQHSISNRLQLPPLSANSASKLSSNYISSRHESDAAIEAQIHKKIKILHVKQQQPPTATESSRIKYTKFNFNEDPNVTAKIKQRQAERFTNNDNAKVESVKMRMKRYQSSFVDDLLTQSDARSLYGRE